MFCGKCGRKLEDGVQTCPVCNVKKVENSNLPVQKPKQKNLKPVMFGLLALAFTICCIVFSVSAVNQAKCLSETKQQHMINKERWEINKKYISHKEEIDEFVKTGKLLAHSYGDTDYTDINNIYALDASLERLEELSSDLSKALNNDIYQNFMQDIKDLRQKNMSCYYMIDSNEKRQKENFVLRDSAILSANINNLYIFEPCCQYFGYTDEFLQNSAAMIENEREDYTKYVVVAISFAILALGSGIVLIISIKKSKKIKTNK